VIVSGPVAAPVRYGFTGADDSPDFQLTTTGGLGERYVSLPGGVLLTVNGTTSTWSIPNLHGDIIATVTGTTVTSGFLYDPYGQPLDSSSLAVHIGAVPATRTGTTSDAWHGSAQRGYEHGGGLNQILMGARSYLPELGIFTATDPIEGGNTTTYAYPQDPINAEDLTGTRFTIKAMKYFSEFGGLSKMNAAGPFGTGSGAGGGRSIATALTVQLSLMWSARLFAKTLLRMESRLYGFAERITFGHGARHLVGTGLSAANVEAVIRGQVRSILTRDASPGSFFGRVRIGNTTIEYRAYPLKDGSINVGTYYVPKG
jgi:RHS repeat-associated protein